MKKLIIATALAAIVGTASASTSDEWTFEEWSDWCGDAWEEELAEPATPAEVKERRHAADWRNSPFRNPYLFYHGNEGWSPYGNYLPR